MKSKNKLVRRKLDEKFKQVNALNIERPARGWVKAIREALGLTTTQLATRLGVKHPRILKIEKDESSLSLSSLEKVADALDCKVVYTLVPKTSLEEMAHTQARRKAMKILSKVTHNMALENQAPIHDEFELEDMIQELLSSSQARLWDEDE